VTAPVDQQAVQSYLRELERNLTVLPADEAAQLREQIRAHLDEALDPNSGESEISEVLAALGAPNLLVREAVRSLGEAGRLPRRPWARLGLRTGLALTAVLLLAGTAAGFAITIARVSSLECSCGTLWAYPQDSGRQTNTSADGHTQQTVPYRPGEEQGFYIEIENSTEWTQTVLGLDPARPPFAAPKSSVGVATEDTVTAGTDWTHLTYRPTGSIPPHSSRAIKVLWTTDVCLDDGAAMGIDSLNLRVRVGWFTRTESIELPQGLYLAGNVKSGSLPSCPGN
jgi:hypothetical protein